MIQYETSDCILGNINITEAVEEDEDILFSESYVVAGERLSANHIRANYDLTVIGDIEADVIEINGELIVNGNIKAERLTCAKLFCSGRVQVEKIFCDEDIMSKNVTCNDINVQGSLLVSDTLLVDKSCSVDRNIMAGEGISGNGELSAVSTIVGEYFDFDGEINSNIYEIETMFKSVVEKEDDDLDNTECSFDTLLDVYISNFLGSIMKEEEDTILEEISKCAKVQKISFNELHYLLSEIDRISYMDEIENLRDYIIVKYADSVLPNVIKEYETIEHVFNNLIKLVDYENLEYKAEDLLQFAFSLKIICSEHIDNKDDLAEKIFGSIGLKYNFVKERFERG